MAPVAVLRGLVRVERVYISVRLLEPLWHAAHFCSSPSAAGLAVVPTARVGETAAVTA